MTEQTAEKRPWYNEQNFRFGTLLLTIILMSLLTRFNGCDKGGVVQDILNDPSVAGLAGQNRAIQSSLAKLDQIESVVKANQAAIARVQADTTQIKGLIDHAPHAIYRFDPKKQEEVDAAALGRLQAAVQAGAQMSVVHRPAEGAGRTRTLQCATAAVDANDSVLCFGPVLPANSELPDGRRYQEVLRHDGTITLAHWNADGSNVQGARELDKRASVWVAALPYPE